MGYSESDLYSLIRRAEASIEQAKRENAIIDRKIAALNSALPYINQAINMSSDLKAAMAKYHAGGEWSGLLYDAFDRECHKFRPNSMSSDIANMGELRRSVKQEILRLQLQKNHFVALISSCENNISNLTWELSKF